MYQKAEQVLNVNIYLGLSSSMDSFPEEGAVSALVVLAERKCEVEGLAI